MLEKSSNMVSRRPNFRWCCPLETGCFIFAVFSSVLTGIGIIGISFALAKVSYAMRVFSEELQADANPRFGPTGFNLMTDYAATLFVYICAITSFIFSVFLSYGVHKRRPGFVKAYLIYGIVLTILMMLVAIGYSVLMADMLGGSLILIVCGIYSIILLMVQRTYEIFRAEAIRDRTQLLDSKPSMKA